MELDPSLPRERDPTLADDHYVVAEHVRGLRRVGARASGCCCGEGLAVTAGAPGIERGIERLAGRVSAGDTRAMNRAVDIDRRET